MVNIVKLFAPEVSIIDVKPLNPNELKSWTENILKLARLSVVETMKFFDKYGGKKKKVYVKDDQLACKVTVTAIANNWGTFQLQKAFEENNCAIL